MTVVLALLLIAALLGMIVINTTPRPAGQDIGKGPAPTILMVVAVILVVAVVLRTFNGV